MDASNKKKLNQHQLKELNDDLLQLQEQLQCQLDDTREQSDPVVLDQQATGRLTRMDAIQQQEMAKANRQQHLLLLNRVKLALAAMAEGDYGYCNECDEPIGYGRLKARPDSLLCIGCQSSHE